MPSVKDKIQAAIIEYNKYRVNLVRAELKEYHEGYLIVYFDGSFCETCGYYDYYEDLQVLLEDDYKVNSRIAEITHLEEGDNVKIELI